MKYEERRSPEYVNGIIDLLIEDSRWIKAQKKSEMVFPRRCYAHEIGRFLCAHGDLYIETYYEKAI